MAELRVGVAPAVARSRSRARRATVFLLLLVCASAASARSSDGVAPEPDPAPRRVLILSSYGSDFALFNSIASSFRSEIARRLGAAVDFYEVPVDLARFADVESQSPFVDYLAALFAGRRLDLVVTLGGPAARFVQAHRAELFKRVPVLYTAVDGRFTEPRVLTSLDATLAVNNDLQATVEAILKLVPETERVAVVFGSSPLERFWRDEVHRMFARFEGRLRFLWLQDLSLEQVRARVADLPPRSAVLFVLLLVDGAGVPHSQERALAEVREASQAPVFGLFDMQVGQGIVGGPLMPMARLGGLVAEAAGRLLAGEPPEQVRYPALGPTEWVFDARELDHWQIPASRLPPGSKVINRPRSVWERFRWQLLGGLALIGLQSVLLGYLVVNRALRRGAESEVRSLTGRLLSAYELERRRLARELHDDVSQRLARLAIDGAQAERLRASEAGAETLRRMREELARLGHDVHALSRRLHPSILDDLGLAEAVRAEAERVGRGGGLAVDLQLEGAPAHLPAETGLCLFRIVQEALRNVEQHARAARVEITLRPMCGGLELVVRDDGIGFDPDGRRARAGLGQVSMRERLNLVGGRFSIESAAGRGTTVRAWAPLPEGAG